MSDNEKGLSRRGFLKTTGIAAGALVGGGLIGGLVGYNTKDNKQISNEMTNGEQHGAPSSRARMFFTNDKDFMILSAATERIFPKDDLGPGAIELDVPYFIDHQLAGNYGSNAREYMQGPFKAGQSTQGYQSRLTRAEIFQQGITKIESESQSRFKKGFSDLENAQMDEILTVFQKDEVAMTAVSSGFFFKLLRQATLEGAYSDPLYSGNNNMGGWRMKEFPGHQGSYAQVIDKEGFQKIEPKSLSSMQNMQH
ncbi:gluconate 2-dehydrogenase subunit 3 family protein [Domibacillus mangrovi]|uniref:Dehydrogenase n=1 Tax=Domibacillus mangrovi TaxID=1714354 RepID=A0A1Q5P3A5_9BACI|nr:gluconate 2-dehydrogenase subunit 3 family protein [Domibacillus mangrovi]OKL36653.1 dehydrogenase [Domibacillus mangrovi]